MERFRHVHFFDEGPATVVTLRPTRSAGDRPCRPATSGHDSLDPQMLQFVAAVLQRSGLSLEAYRPTTLARRIRVCLRSLGAASLSEAQARLQREPRLLPVALNSLLLGVTKFFRDAKVFRYLDEMVFPVWADNARERRIWSAGCSNGAELYSIAMLLERHQLLSSSWLLGTDCREDALQRARRGWFDSL